MGWRHPRRGSLTLLVVGLLHAPGCGDDEVGPVRDLTPPTLLEGPRVEQVTAHAASVLWRTDEATNATVFFSADTVSGWADTTTSDYAVDHAFTLAALDTSTRYFFRIQSADRAGNAVGTLTRSFQTFSERPTLVMDPWETTLAVGDTVSLAIRALNMEDLFQVAFVVGLSGVAVDLGADTLRVGPLLGEPRQALWLFDAEARLLEVAITRLHDSGGVSADGTVAWLCLRAGGSGTAWVGFEEGSVVLGEPSGQPIADFDLLEIVESTVSVQ